jgi:hypothetical protein
MDIKPKDTTGTNIVNKIDYQKLANEFLVFFYSSWKDKSVNIVNIINGYTRISYQKNIYKGEDVIKLLFSLNTSGMVFEIVDTNAMDDGSRKIQIMVNGFVEQAGVKYRLSQDFTITFQNDSWKIQNSILNIFI